mmetsp:Transcript_82469/g.212467  ORF Transcript_82469/g.212467 Transcript_82469/m.212467 type:complete len:221 (-) Transcript_82469:7-669(-)
MPSSSFAKPALQPTRSKPSTTSTSNMYLPCMTSRVARMPFHRCPSSLLHSKPSSVTRTNMSLSLRLSSHLRLDAAAFLTVHLPRNVSCTICRHGKPKAPVLPLPVSAAARTSPPPRISGTASACTGVGNSQSSSSMAWMISGQMPSSSKALMGAGSPTAAQERPGSGLDSCPGRGPGPGAQAQGGIEARGKKDAARSGTEATRRCPHAGGPTEATNHKGR